MAERHFVPRLSPRDREILRDIVHTYIVTGEPVSSRTISKSERLGVSAATVRNVMADLEELGFLAQPHTSAGRVPTPAGYHLFIESLMQSRSVPARERRYIDETLRSSLDDPERLVAMAGHLLSELSSLAGIVVAPAIGDTVLKEVQFVPLSERRAVCVVVSADGFADSKVIELDAPVGRDELQRIGNYLTANFAGMTLRQVRDRLLQQMAEERAQVDRLLQLTLSLATRGLRLGSEPAVVVDGAAALLAAPELSSVDRVRRLLDTFEDRARLVEILSRCADGRGIRVFIGEDTDLTSELDFSLVGTSYAAGDRVLGSLGVFGPSRMEYARIIPLVHYLGATLGEALQGLGRGEETA